MSMREERQAAVLAMAVLTAMRPARLCRPSERPSVDPELNPNHPNLPQSMWPGGTVRCAAAFEGQGASFWSEGEPEDEYAQSDQRRVVAGDVVHLRSLEREAASLLHTHTQTSARS
jgi:hypothetical protein